MLEDSQEAEDTQYKSEESGDIAASNGYSHSEVPSELESVLNDFNAEDYVLFSRVTVTEAYFSPSSYSAIIE